jgi:uncharacterized protein (TIGR01777 family)
MPVFRHQFELDHPPEEVFAWHARPGALRRLTPPWESIRVKSRTGGLEVGATAVLTIRRGPVDLTWEVRHTAYEKDRLFVDEQVRGPFATWRHEHRFEPIEGGRTRLEDVVEWEPPLGTLGEIFTNALIEKSLARLFRFRATRLAGDLSLHQRYGAGNGRVVAITGATGLIGTALGLLLETGGYRVLRISRAAREGEGWIRWDPAAGELDPHALEGVHAVINLAGESIAGIRWTPAKKEAILKSRQESTLLLSRTLAELDRLPEVFVSASAVGYYGNRGDERLTEGSGSGKGFLAEVCRKWEAATHTARAVGIRTVHLRGGVVLSPGGGVIGTTLLPFKLGLGGRLGSGRQYMSWVDLDDHTGMILHAMAEPRVRGALNSTSPNPVTNAAFADVLGRVLGRPTVIPVPSLGVRALLGEMGVELLLWGQRVLPQKAQETGYRFHFSHLEDSLAYQLGREEP